MGKKVVYKLAVKLKPDASLQDNLPKKTRGLLLQLQVAQEHKKWSEANVLLEELGDLYEAAEDIPKSIDTAKKELKLANSLPEPDSSITKARALHRLTKGYRKLREFNAAIDYGKQYIATAQYLEDGREQLQGYHELALAHMDRCESDEQQPNDVENAQKALKSAGGLLKHLDKEAREDMRADLNLNIGITYKHAAQPDRAIIHIMKALDYYKKQGNKPNEANAYLNLGLCYQDKRDIDQSIKCAQKEQQILHEIGDHVNEAKSYWTLGILCKESCRYEEATGFIKAYANLCDIIDDTEGKRQAQTAFRDIKECIRKERRIEMLTETLEQLHKQQDTRRLFDVLAERGELLLELGKSHEALRDFLEQKRLAFLLKLSKERQEKVLYNLGLSYAAQSRYGDAIRTYKDALNRFEGTPEQRLALLISLGDAYQEDKGTSYDTISRTYEEALQLGRTLSNLDAQREALAQLEWLNHKHNYVAKAQLYAKLLSEVEGLVNAGNPETPEDSYDQDLGSADPDMMTDAESDSPGEQPRPTVSDGTYDDATSAFKENSLPSIQYAAEKDEELVPTVRKPKSKGSKYTIHTLANDEVESIEVPAPPVREKTSADSQRMPTPRSASPDEPQAQTSTPSTLKKQCARKRLRIESSPEPPDAESGLEVGGATDISAGAALRSTPAVQHVVSPTGQTTCPQMASDGAIIISSTPISRNSGEDIKHSSATSTRLSHRKGRRACTPVNVKQQPTPGSSRSSAASMTPIKSAAKNAAERPMKVRVVMKAPNNQDEIFAVSCPNGPHGTPKTVAWLIDEARRRYDEIYHVKPPIMKLVTVDPETSEQETLGKEDIISDVLVNKQKVVGIGI